MIAYNYAVYNNCIVIKKISYNINSNNNLMNIINYVIIVMNENVLINFEKIVIELK